jgi:H+/Cl- antiporter ClcA
MTVIKNFITFIFIIIALYCIGFICILYRDAFTNLSIEAKMNIFKNPKAMYLLTPLLFWVASRSFYFKHANGPLNSNIHNLFKNIAFPNYFKTDFPFTSILALISSSLFAVYAGGALGPETPIIYMCIILLLYAHSSFKTIFKNFSSELKIESLLYLGYIFGITLIFRSPLASFILSIEKSLRDGSSNVLMNVAYCCIGIFVAYTITDDKTGNLFQDRQDNSQQFEYKIIHVIQYLFLAVICGFIASILMKIMTLLFYGVRSLMNKSKIILNFVPILFGLCVAALINYSDNSTRIVGSGIKLVNCELNDTCTYNFAILFQFLCNVILTFISGCSGGQKFVFMSIGGGIGSLYDKFTSVPHFQSIIVGITAFLSTIFGNPISSAIIIMKTTNLPYESLPMLTAVSLVSYHAFKYINSMLFYNDSIKYFE